VIGGRGLATVALKGLRKFILEVVGVFAFILRVLMGKNEPIDAGERRTHHKF
jgi:hypothetical protein